MYLFRHRPTDSRCDHSNVLWHNRDNMDKLDRFESGFADFLPDGAKKSLDVGRRSRGGFENSNRSRNLIQLLEMNYWTETAGNAEFLSPVLPYTSDA
jgi:hypothetical protein